jgi:hypothetical protein
MTPRVAGYALLFVLAVGNMGADAAGARTLKGLATATGAAPAPKVFTTVRGLEMFSCRYLVRWTDAGGARRALELTPEVYARLGGPYARRNAYGAALSYGPVLAADPRTRPMLDGALAYALRPGAPLVRELGIDAGARDLRVQIVPQAGCPESTLSLELAP